MTLDHCLLAVIKLTLKIHLCTLKIRPLCKKAANPLLSGHYEKKIDLLNVKPRQLAVRGEYL